MSRTKRLQGSANAAIIIVATVAIAVLVNILGGLGYTRVDLTAHNLNLLSDTSNEAVEVMEGLEIRAYISDDLPPSVQMGQQEINTQGLARHFKDKLEEYKAAGGGDVTLTYVTDNVVDKAMQNKLVPVQGKAGTRDDKGRFSAVRYVIGATFHYKGAVEAYELALHPECEGERCYATPRHFEFEITKRLRRLKDKAEHSLKMKDVLRAGSAIEAAVKRCASALEAAAPEVDDSDPMALLTGKATNAKVEAYRASAETLKLDCGDIDAALSAAEPHKGKHDQLDRVMLVSNAFKETWAQVEGALASDDPQAAGLIVNGVARLVALGDATTQEHDDLVDAPGRRRIGVVCNGISMCPFPDQTPLIPEMMVGALTKENPILGQMLPQVQRIQQEMNQQLAQIEQILFRSQGFTVARVDLDEEIPADVKALLVFGPRGTFSDYQLYQLDQFVMRSGSLVVFLNAWDVAYQNYNVRGQFKDPALTKNTSNIGTLLANWGVTVPGDLVLEPSAHGETVVFTTFIRQGDQLISFQRQGVGSPLVPRFSTFDDDDPLVRSLTSVTLPYATSLKLAAPAGVTATPLITTSAEAVTTSDPSFPIAPEEALARISGLQGGGALPVAAVVSGTLPSGWAGKEAPAAPPKPDDEAGKGDEDDKGDAAVPEKFPRQDKGEGRVLVIGSNLGIEPLSREAIFEGFNIGMVANKNSMDYIEKFREYGANFQNWFTRIRQIQHTLGVNLPFLSNALDWSIQRGGLAELRSKQFTQRPLDVKKDDQAMIQMLGILLAPVIFLLGGLIYWVLRRKREQSLKL